jgi:predicted DNA-binding transcriptional regulator
MTERYANEQAKLISESFKWEEIRKSYPMRKSAEAIAKVLRKQGFKCKVDTGYLGYILIVNKPQP